MRVRSLLETFRGRKGFYSTCLKFVLENSGGHDHKMRIQDRRPFPGPQEGRFDGPGRKNGLKGTPKPKIQRDPSPLKGNLICGTSPCEFIGFGAMDATKTYEFIGYAGRR
jgi:hypothetical protein